MDKNYLKYACLWTLLVLAGLLLMHSLPPMTVGTHTLRKVDLLSDVRTPTVAPADPDSLLPAPSKPKVVFVDTCRTGVTCIEDYSDSTLRGMTPFYRALDELKTRPRAVRIAVFGDSFIEGDIFTADLRNLLQSRYGGCGVGYVDVTSKTNGYRPTVRHTFGGWNSHAATDSIGFVRGLQGISCHYFIPQSNAYVHLEGQSKYARHLDTVQQATIYFHTRGKVALSARINNSRTETDRFLSDNDLQQMTVRGRIGDIRWTVEEADSARFYGVAMDGQQGISVDNFSLRGSSGLSLTAIPARTLRAFNRWRSYDLIVLQYGLNVATERGRNYDKYRNGMLATIAHLKASFPQAGLLIIGVGDRDYRTEEGNIRTMPGIKNLIRYQQNLAADSGIAFWNLFQAMGGEGSMRKLVEATPPMANLDYTHINFRGGKHLSELLYNALLEGKEQYDRRRAYEAAK
ncbi:MAG: SGNH/GDSL hydrolase family protein [Prevotellaceae bacterium]|jgi:hypothetical protein|nr:SGNH/GDSL hydrolase family protein [Prevotellaceae bacterium]